MFKAEQFTVTFNSWEEACDFLCLDPDYVRAISSRQGSDSMEPCGFQLDEDTEAYMNEDIEGNTSIQFSTFDNSGFYSEYKDKAIKLNLI